MTGVSRTSTLSPADFRLLFERVPGNLLVLDPELRIVGVTDGYLRATMRQRDALVGLHIFDAFPDNPEDPAATGVANLAASLGRVLRLRLEDAMAVQKYDIPKPDDPDSFEVRYWSPLNAPVLADDGSLAFIIHRVEDVTEFVRLHDDSVRHDQDTQELRQRTDQMETEILRRSQDLDDANRRLRVADDAKNRFLSRMSHELRTPLTSVLGFAELLALTPVTDEQRDWVDTISRSGQHLLALLNDLLDIARIEEGALALSIEAVPAGQLLTEAVEMVQPMAAGNDITLVLEDTREGPRYVLADRQRLRQVLINLLSNAIKYNRPEGTVTIRLRASGTCLRFEVADTGAGLTDAEQERLFMPFERLDAAARGIEGTGLGLALSRQLVETMGGHLSVSSTPGVGSTFWLELASIERPVIEGTEGDRGTVRKKRYASGRRVLYLDDVVTNIQLVEQILSWRPDITLVSTTAGKTALELARDRPPDLAVLDLHVADMGGEEVLRQLREHPSTRELPVIILTADATTSQTDRLAASGADAYLTKPIAIAQFLDVVDGFLTEK